MRAHGQAVAVVCLVLVSLLAAREPAGAMEVVHFPSAVLPPSALKVKLAKDQGKELKAEPGLAIWGHLGKPKGAGPFSAVVMMHGCSGIFPVHVAWARLLNDLGYVTLILDSFRPRSVFNVCFGLPGVASPAKCALDAHGALAYLRDLDPVDAARVGLIVWSHGGISTLDAVSASGIAERLPYDFKAAVAFYPFCISPRSYDLPILILIGEADDWTPQSYCQDLLAHSRKGSNSVELIVYPGAFHAFDVPSLRKGWRLEGPGGL